MSTAPSQSLKDLRDILRDPATLPDTDTFLYHLSSTLQALHIHPTSIPPEHIPKDVLAGISRYLSTVQILLITSALPTFWHVLDDRQKETVEAFFVSSKSAERNVLPIHRAIALNTYLTIVSLLSTHQNLPAPTIPIPLHGFILGIAERLVKVYNVDEMYWAVWAGSSGDGAGSRTLQWGDTVKAMIGLPGKVANAVGRWKADRWEGDIPPGLYPRAYFDGLIFKFESLWFELSHSTPRPNLGPLQLILQRLATAGIMSQPPSSISSPEPTFFYPLLPPLLAHLNPPPNSSLPPYPGDFLPDLFLSLPTSTIVAFTASLLQYLALNLGDGKSSAPDEGVKRAAEVLSKIIGPSRQGGEAWDAVLRLLRTNKSGNGFITSRIAIAWISAGDERCAHALTEQLLEVWTDHKNIKYGLYTTQINLTFSVILSLSLHPANSSQLLTLSHSSHFLSSMQSYLAHPDPKVRRLGMLVAEIISELTIPDTNGDSGGNEMAEIEELKKGLDGEADGGGVGSGTKKGLKRLKFGKGMWEGVGEGREECRWLRGFVGLRDGDAVLADDPSGKSWLLGWHTPNTEIKPSPITTIDIQRPQARRPVQPRQKVKLPNIRSKPKIIMLDPDQSADPLHGYTSNSPSSSRSASPTQEYLEEVAADPTLALDTSQRGKIKRPVYIMQLIALLRDRDKPESLEMGLKWGEGLVRAKRLFGTELEENAVELAAMTIALNDPFNLDDFDDLRQGLLNALVACSPRNTAPYLSEQYFNNQYSLQQKSVILTALAMGARELAGLSVPTPQTMNRKIDFPSKTLPASLHKKYITENDMGGQLEAAIDGVRGLLLSTGVKRGEDLPEFQREKRLRVGSTRKSLIAEVGSIAETRVGTEGIKPHDPVVPFKDIAAEYFIMPFINRFYQHFQDASAREMKAMTSGLKYRGAGTGLILSPMALEKLLMTLALLLHAARHSPVFLTILAPECMELAMMIGSRHLSSPDDNPVISGESQDGGNVKVQEGQVVGSALELALVALDGSVDLDMGRTLAVDKAGLVVGVGEWAGSVFERESGGGEVAAGQGGMREGRIRAGAAGVVLKVAEIGDKWGRMGLLR